VDLEHKAGKSGSGCRGYTSFDIGAVELVWRRVQCAHTNSDIIELKMRRHVQIVELDGVPPTDPNLIFLRNASKLALEQRGLIRPCAVKVREV
jgi:hypothetical protein